MIVYPSIDIQGDRVVRLRHGDIAASEDAVAPLEAAARWIREGARWLHVVDVDGARTGTPGSLDLIRAVADLGVPLQVVGGIRDLATAALFDRAGATRLVASGAGPEERRRLVDRYGGRLAVTLYVRDGALVGSPWGAPSTTTPETLLRQLADDGVRTAIYADVSAAGSLAGPDLAGLASAAAAFTGELIYSGGVGSLEDIRALARSGHVSGVVVGRALDLGRFTLPRAMSEGLTERPAAP